MGILERPLVVIGAVAGTAALLIAFLFYTFGAQLKFGGALLLMVAIGALSRVPQRFAGGDIGIEMIMLFTVCTAVSEGAMLGGLVGAAAMALSWFFTRERPDDVLIGVFGFLLAGFLAGMLNVGGILALGVLVTVIYDVVICGVYVFTGHSPAGCAKFVLTHIVWNFVMFRSFAPYVMLVLA
ncbi:MAG: hypothetical protein ABH829_05065 [archaeon]